MATPVSRRDALRYGGVGAATILAGCNRIASRRERTHCITASNLTGSEHLIEYRIYLDATKQARLPENAGSMPAFKLAPDESRGLLKLDQPYIIWAELRHLPEYLSYDEASDVWGGDDDSSLSVRPDRGLKISHARCFHDLDEYDTPDILE